MFSIITKIWSESFDFALSLLLTHVVCMETYIIMLDHQWFMLNRLWRQSYCWSWLLLFSHLIMLNYFYIYSNLALTYISDMLQIFDNDYVTLTPFSRSFKYIFPNWILTTHSLWLTEYRFPPWPTFPLTLIESIKVLRPRQGNLRHKFHNSYFWKFHPI